MYMLLCITMLLTLVISARMISVYDIRTYVRVVGYTVLVMGVRCVLCVSLCVMYHIWCYIFCVLFVLTAVCSCCGCSDYTLCCVLCVQCCVALVVSHKEVTCCKRGAYVVLCVKRCGL